MASRGQIPFKRVLKMLKDCAPGYTITLKTHKQWARYRGRTFYLPKGPHGTKGQRFDIEIGHVRGLVREFEIDQDCARKHLPQL